MVYVNRKKFLMILLIFDVGEWIGHGEDCLEGGVYL